MNIIEVKNAFRQLDNLEGKQKRKGDKCLIGKVKTKQGEPAFHWPPKDHAYKCEDPHCWTCQAKEACKCDECVAERKALYTAKMKAAEPKEKLSPMEVAFRFRLILAKEFTDKGYKVDRNNWIMYNSILAYCLEAQTIADQITQEYGRTFDPKKGVFFHGPVGIGKTSALEHCSKKAFFRGWIVACSEMAANIKKKDGGFDWLERQIECPNLVIDELGKDEKVNIFGTWVHPVDYLVSKRYRLNEEGANLKTSFTSNLSLAELAEIYDERVLDRIVAMANLLKFNGKSYRK